MFLTLINQMIMAWATEPIDRHVNVTMQNNDMLVITCKQPYVIWLFGSY